MNELLKDAVQPYIEDVSDQATMLFNAYIAKVDEAVRHHSKVPKNQPLLDPLVRLRILALINGDDVEDITNIEYNVVKTQLAKAVAAIKEGK